MGRSDYINESIHKWIYINEYPNITGLLKKLKKNRCTSFLFTCKNKNSSMFKFSALTDFQCEPLKYRKPYFSKKKTAVCLSVSLSLNSVSSGQIDKMP